MLLAGVDVNRPLVGLFRLRLDGYRLLLLLGDKLSHGTCFGDRAFVGVFLAETVGSALIKVFLTEGSRVDLFLVGLLPQRQVQASFVLRHLQHLRLFGRYQERDVLGLDLGGLGIFDFANAVGGEDFDELQNRSRSRERPPIRTL